jgi:hypothetical protein
VRKFESVTISLNAVDILKSDQRFQGEFMKVRVLKTLVALCVVAFASYGQSATSVQRMRAGPKMDLLFVIDNSGSMSQTLQSLVANLPAFIQRLEGSVVDFRIGVTTTDAYLGHYYLNGDHFFKLRDGSGSIHTGVFIVTPETPDLAAVLAKNLNQGVAGSGDERAFSSFKDVLQFSENSEFRRSDAALSVVVISDEDDFSHNDLSDDPTKPTKNYRFSENYEDPTMYPISDFSGFLKSLGGKHSSSFSTVSVQTQACLSKMQTAKISRRYNELAEATGGMKGDICDIAASLESYAQFVVANAAPADPGSGYVIKLDHTPILETIVVKVNGKLIVQNAESGWTYEATTVSLTLHGTAVPKKGDLVSVTYDYQE